MKATCYTNLVEGGCTIQGNVLIEESAVNEVVGYLIQVDTNVLKVYKV